MNILDFKKYCDVMENISIEANVLFYYMEGKTMKRNDFIKIIKLRSFWKIDKRTGNYKLPSGNYLSDYVEQLVRSQMKIDRIGISRDGNFNPMSGGEHNDAKKCFEDYTIIIPFECNEVCTWKEQEDRINHLVKEIVG